MDVPTEDSPFAGWQRATQWQYETARATLKRSLEMQRAAVDSWVGAVESAAPRETPHRGQIRWLAWAYDVWEETVLNGLVHLDDAITEDGIDLQSLQMIWLHAMDDAFSEVLGRPVVATEINETLETELTEQRRLNGLRRDVLHAANLPADRDLEAVGRRLLDLEARQKRIEEKVDALLDATGADADGDPDTRFGVVE